MRNLLNEVIVENFSNIGKEKEIQIPEAQRTPPPKVTRDLKSQLAVKKEGGGPLATQGSGQKW